jgi:hypothetical protein
VELADDDMKIFAEVFGYPSALLAGYNNQNKDEAKTAGKVLYNQTVIPYSEHIYQQLTEYIIGKDSNIAYHVDFGHIGALQADAKEESETRAKNAVSVSLLFQNGWIRYGQGCEILNVLPNEEWKDNYFNEMPKDLIQTFRLSNTGIENPNANQNQEPKE